MAKYRFDQIAINSIEKKKPVEEDRFTYIGLEHLDSGSLTVSRYGSDVAPVGEKLVMHKGDVLFGKRRAYQKKVAIAPFDGIFSAHGMVLRPREEVVDKGFFPLFISSDFFLNAAIQISVGSLSPTINWKDLRELEFELPDLDTQRKLSQVLWAIINTVEAYKHLIAVSDELVKSQFIAEFGDPLINPMGWKTMTMKEASLLMSDGPFGSNLKSSHYSEHGVRVIRLQNICQGYFSDDDKAYIPLEHYEKIKRYTCKAGEIVIGTLGEPNLRACIIPEHISIAINKADCVHYVPNPELLDNDYVCAFLNNPATLAMVSSGIHGNTRQRISAGQLANTLIMLPPIPTQKSFGSKMRQLDKSKHSAQKALEDLQATQKALIRKYLG